MMPHFSELFIGLISGTSMDAVDALLIDFAHSPQKIVGQFSQPFPDHIRTRLSQPDTLHVRDIGELDVELGNLFADAVLELLKLTNVPAKDIVAIGSHGQTVFHSPYGTHPFTLQIGDPNIISERTGITTVADFRRRDMAAGGQGAPLVSAFHYAMFQSSQELRAILNIGGIANLTLLPAYSGSPVTGFDTGPGNGLMDSWTMRHRQQTCDDNGIWAASGNCNTALLEQLMEDSYFSLPPPKSTGREYFSLVWLEENLSRFKLDITLADVQATLAEFTAASITHAIDAWAPDTLRILVCGGGVHNPYLMDTLRQKLDGNRQLQSTLQHHIDPDWVEAAAFAWLAKQTLLGNPGNIMTVTGARRPVVLGGIYHS